ncbi:ribonuclease R [Aliikangiella coralliicola]|uniref:Ribonuclease R n=1 Tax=Aliikangiella coralliicola TaxID=2592383 RepID=A0A545UBV1_9GAMM|nr:ribonuclease R [Aliikangiella coralliicola]TQV86945.1 ribonuclease R [Aliikangiella coralliicola]
MAKKKSPSIDPHFDRESKKYDNPIPSREFILELLEKAGGPLKFKAIQFNLNLFDVEQEVALSRRLKAMERDGQLHCDRRGAYGIVDKLDLVAGTVIGHRDGFGFFTPESGGDDWLLSAREMRRVFPGERVLVREKKVHSDGRKEAGIVEILEKDEPLQIVGRYYQESGINFVTPEDTRIVQDILIPPDDPLKVESGQVVVVHVVTRPTVRSKAVGTVAQVLGDYLAPGMEIEIAIAQYGIRNQWSSEVHDQLQQLPLEVEESELKGRVDLRDLPLITIDGEDARDFDDAVYCKPTSSGGWKLWVAIADVSHYVRPDSPLDLEAQKRGNSVYFPNSVVPMLPEQVSNGLCSLKPEVDRLCMVCEMNVSAKGKVSRSKFYPAVMHSKARMTYTKVWKIIQGDEALVEQYSELLKPIHDLHQLYQARLLVKQQRGAIDFETTETQILFNDNRKIDKIVPVVRNDAHKIIEECMICANVAAAKFFIKNKTPGLYRVHLGPKEKKLEKFRGYLAELGLFITGGAEPAPEVFQRLLEEVSVRPDAENIQIMLLRSMSQAEYSPDNEGHFGLAFDAYTHFTSPIRRYPDLIVHRIIKALVADEALQSSRESQQVLKRYDRESLATIGQTSSMTERNADMATRDVVDWLKCEYMQSHIGKQYSGVVSGVTNFGLFVRLDEVFVEGLVHVTELGSDYFHYDSTRQRMIGEKTRQSFGIGDELEIEVAQVDIEQRKIDFTLVEVMTQADGTKRKMSEREKLYARARMKSMRDKNDVGSGRKKKSKSVTSKSKVKKKVASKAKSKSSRRKKR